ncbi:putative regulatory protein [Mycobacteroides stephanolepidis]|uniref:Putative regulatory protein n=1 Tax=[Mycobacterium] stephanolepidis TaxID=1520670 RepID=A0A1Z4EXW5_9MYCO|nr:BTAD domain-containing putative transcriptional regulator [[Mycobacterium] stephanolepidis]BAX97799.1 putative regulatory protein [[Mycobacterium] stephanolepidis]
MRAKIELLGPLQVRVGDRACIPSGAKLQNALTLLSVHSGEVLARDELIEELALTGAKDTINALHANIRRLRNWLELQGVSPDLLQTAGRSGYRLDVTRQDVDAYVFIRWVNEGFALRTKAPSVAVAMLEKALSTWRGTPLQEMTDSLRVQSLSRELVSSKELAQETLLACYLSLKMAHEAAAAAQQYTLDNPYNERIWGSRIAALRMLGRNAEAARTYREIQKLLYEDLRVSPSESLRLALTDISWKMP